MYSYVVRKEQGEIEEKHRAKGIQLAVAKNFRHADYLKELKKPLENIINNKRIGAKLHQIYSIESKKRGLCAFDDKRVLLEDEIHTLAYGHYKVTGSVQEIEGEEPKLQISSETDGSLLSRNRFFKGYVTSRGDAKQSAGSNAFPFQSVRPCNKVSLIIDEVLQEKIHDLTNINKEYYINELYDFGLKLFRKKKSDSEIKMELRNMLEEILKPQDLISNEFNFGLESEGESEEESEIRDSDD